MIVLIVVSFQWVDVGSYGLDVNYIVQQIDLTKVYPEGRYFLGLGHGFLMFPKTVQSLHFSGNETITARTRDGLALDLGVSLQFELQGENIAKLWQTLNTDFEATLINVAVDLVRDTSSNWRAVEFFHNRSQIETDLRASLTEGFKSFYATLRDVQLKSIDLPDRFETAIQETEVANQDITKASFELQSSQVLASTKIMYANVNQTSMITQYAAQAQALLVQKRAYQQGLNLTTSATADAAAILASGAGLSPAELIQYFYIQALLSHTPEKLVLGVGSPMDLSKI